MRLAYRTRKLQRCAVSVGDATRPWGSPVGRTYVQRINRLRVLVKWSEAFDIQAWRAHPLKGARRGSYAIDLHGRWRLIVSPDAAGRGLMIEEVSNHYDD